MFRPFLDSSEEYTLILKVINGFLNDPALNPGSRILKINRIPYPADFFSIPHFCEHYLQIDRNRVLNWVWAKKCILCAQRLSADLKY